jgi:hypothetical protein
MTAVQYAENVAGVSVVSMSWGVSEFNGETTYDADFSHAGVTFVGASGDSGSPGIWPALSPNVLAVGGTTLNVGSSGVYSSESAWGVSGGGTSTYESEPSYQLGVQSTGKRTSPDVSYDANPNTGFAVYDSLEGGWQEVGGTSAGAPQWAAILAIANQGRAIAGESALTGGQAAIYGLSSSDFHDITSGGNGGYAAKSGYDEVTGRGTPIGNLVISGLVSYSSSSSSTSSSGAGSSSSGSSSTGSSGSGSSGSGSSGSGSSGKGTSGSGSSGSGSSGSGSSGKGSSGSSGSGSSGSGSSGSSSSGSGYSGFGHGRGGRGFGFGFGGGYFGGGFGGFFGPFFSGYSFGFLVEVGSGASGGDGSESGGGQSLVTGSSSVSSGNTSLAMSAAPITAGSSASSSAFNAALTSITTQDASLSVAGSTAAATVDQLTASTSTRLGAASTTVNTTAPADELCGVAVISASLSAAPVDLNQTFGSSPSASRVQLAHDRTTPIVASRADQAVATAELAVETDRADAIVDSVVSLRTSPAVAAAVWADFDAAEDSTAMIVVESLTRSAEPSASETSASAWSVPTPVALAAVGVTIGWAQGQVAERKQSASQQIRPRRRRRRAGKSAN